MGNCVVKIAKSSQQQLKPISQNLENETLYVITTIFNPARYDRRIILYNQFRERLQMQNNIFLVTIECIFEGGQYVVTQPNSEPQQIQVKAKSRLWLKENLINKAITLIPKNWKYVAWLDADLEFAENNWAIKVMEALNKNYVVQVFEEMEDLGPENEVIRKCKSFCYFVINGLQINRKNFVKPETYPHPGYGWAIRRDFYDLIGGIYDKDMLGNSDVIMAYSYIGRVQEIFPQRKGLAISDVCKKSAVNFQNKVKKLMKGKLGYATNLVKHHWHGSKKDRKYVDRWKIIQQHKFDPDNHLQIDENGLYFVDDKLKGFENDVLCYFIGRDEDSQTIQQLK